jgi:hypothetical protein
MSTKPIEEWLKTVMACERYDLLKQKTSRDLTDEEAEIVNNQLESESIETGVKLF